MHFVDLYRFIISQYTTQKHKIFVFYVHVTVHRNKFLFNKIKQTHLFPKFIFVEKLYMFRAVPVPIIRSFPLTFGTGICQQTCMTYNSAERTVEDPEDGQRNCPKHLEFLDKNELEKLVRLLV
jgi:hypothetical protein